jgi:hypothetical protein
MIVIHRQDLSWSTFEKVAPVKYQMKPRENFGPHFQAEQTL